jgi:N-acetyl-anhydromuramyl-L-alanine amidase AmpD
VTIPFLQAKDYSPQKAKRRIDFFVILDMEAPEKGDTAESIARYFHNGPASPSSAHYCVDATSIVQCVRENDIAYHAPPNTHSIGVEHAGYARQSKSEWTDTYSTLMLRDRSAPLVADLCAKYGIPVRFLSPADLKAGKRGITTHANVTAAWHETTHTDPGPNFPMTTYIGWVKDATRPAFKPAPTPKEDNDMQLSDKVTIPASYESAKATGATEWPVETALARIAEWAFRGYQDASVARALAEARATTTKPLTADQTKAIVDEALRNAVVKVNVTVDGPAA